MAVNQENVSKVLSVLSHPLRRDILLDLSNNGESSFTDLLNLLKVDTGKLSFHLRSLSHLSLSRRQAANTNSAEQAKAQSASSMMLKAGQKSPMYRAKQAHYRFHHLKNGAFAFSHRFCFNLCHNHGDHFYSAVAVAYLQRVLGSEISTLLFITIGLLWLYSTLLEGFNGQSIGKRVIGLKVVRTDGKKMSYDHAAVRNFGKVLPLLPFDLLFGWRIKNQAFMRYFDKFAGTTVIDLRS